MGFVAASQWVNATTWKDLVLAQSPPPLPPIKAIKFKDNPGFDLQQLHRIAERLIGKPPSKQALEDVRFDISKSLYENHYFTSGAIIERDEDLSDGEITFTLIGGKIESIEPNIATPAPGNRSPFDVGRPLVSPQFYHRRLSEQIQTPINRENLTQILNDWPSYYPIEEIHMTVEPGKDRGEARILVDIDEKERFNAGLSIDNHRAPSSGAEQANILLHSESLTRHRDTLDIDYGLLRNLDGKADWLGADQFGIRYEVPVRVDNSRTAVYFRRSTSSLIEEPFGDLDIRSRFQLTGWSLSHPLGQKSKQDWTISLAAEHKRLETTLAGEAVDLSEGFENGEASVAAIRLSTRYLQRSTKSVLGIRAAISSGLDALGATTNEDRDGRFLTVLTDVQYVYEFGTNTIRSQLITRGTGQISTDPLLTIEQIPVGGANSVRGYRENSLVRDSAVYGSLEYRIPVLPHRESLNLRLALFGDAGYGTNRGPVEDRTKFISSYGAGILAQPYKNSELSLYVGVPLQDISDRNSDLQDFGLHFKFTTWAF